MDDGRLGEFQSVQVSSFLTEYIANNVVKGFSYRFRYRVSNYNGFSQYSAVSYIFPFSVPDTPAKPVFVSAMAESVTLSLAESLNDNGVPVVGYELWIDAGDDTLSDFIKVDSYTGFSATHTLTKLIDGLKQEGTIYRVKFRAINELGKYSAFSHEFVFALGSLPSTPSAPSKIIEESKQDAIMVSWPQVTGDALPLIGYRLYADTGHKDELSLVYDGNNRADTTKFLFNRLANSSVALSNLHYYRF